MRNSSLITFAVISLSSPAWTQAPSVPRPNSVFLEELTWIEVRDAIAAGKTTVIIPTGGTEQNGPHMVLGKHNYMVKYKSREVAKRLGNALVAPVVAYVPEGDVNPPTGHMSFAGTITLPQDVFAKVLEYAARSLKQHGLLVAPATCSSVKSVASGKSSQKTSRTFSPPRKPVSQSWTRATRISGESGHVSLLDLRHRLLP